MLYKKDLIKEIIINRNLDKYKNFYNLIPLDEEINKHKESYFKVDLNDDFYIAFINKNINPDYFIDRKFLNKNELINIIKQNEKESTIPYNVFLEYLKIYLSSYNLYNNTIIEARFMEITYKYRKLNNLFLLYKDNKFFILKLKNILSKDEKIFLNKIKKEIGKFLKQNNIKESKKYFITELELEKYEDYLLGSFEKIKEYIKNFDYKTIYKILDFNYFWNYKKINDYINEKSLDVLFQQIKNNGRIIVFADYDSDGFNSAMQIYKLFRFVGYNNFKILFPTRKAEYTRILTGKKDLNKHTGYGISEKILDELQEGDLLITLDNGGYQIDVFKKILNKFNNIKIIVIDHHNLRYTENKIDDDDLQLLDFFIRFFGIKTNKKDKKQIVLIKENKQVYYNHPYIKADYNLISATIMTWFFILAFLKKYNYGYNLQQIKDFLENIILHAAIGQITDVMGMIPVSQNIGFLIYLYAKKVYKQIINYLDEQLKIYGINITTKDLLTKDWTTKNDFTTLKVKNFIKKFIFESYPKKDGKIIYNQINKEILFLMYFKKIAVFNAFNIGWVIGPVINAFGRLTTVEELFDVFVYLAEEDDFKTKIKFIKNLNNILTAIEIRKNTIKYGQKFLESFIEYYLNLNDELIDLPWNYLKLLVLFNNDNMDYDVFLKLDQKVKDLGIDNVFTNKDKLSEFSDEQIRLYNRKVINFISAFNGLIASKIINSKNINVIVLSSDKKVKNGYLHTHGSGRGLGNIDLNLFLQKLKDKLEEKGLGTVSGGGHNSAVGCSISIKYDKNKFNFEYFLDIYYKIDNIIKEIIQKDFFKDTIDFYKPIIYNNLILVYKKDLNNLFKYLKKIIDKYGIFTNDFSWKKIYIPIESWFNFIYQRENTLNYNDLNFILKDIGLKIYVSKYLKKEIKEKIRKKDLKFLKKIYDYIVLDYVEDLEDGFITYSLI